MRSYQPERGDFCFLNFTPQAGSEQAGDRPALVLSPKSFNVATGLIFACPITNQGKGSPFEIAVPRGSRVTGFVLVSHARSLDWLARGARAAGSAPPALLDEVLARLSAVLFDR